MTDSFDDFLSVAADFQLGSLETEMPHPLTGDLSRLAVDDLPAAIRLLQRVDVLAWERFESRAMIVLPALARDIGETLRAGGRLFFCGCGATGRLSLSLEIFCRKQGLLPPEWADRAVAFMAGGDLALIRAIERFEDRPDFGARQLEELGFGENDLLIASTEGGETPWVIGATERAATLSRRAPWFLYCNPDNVLAEVAERSRRVLENPAIRKGNLAVGPMALSGSTRMQSSTVLMAAIGWAIVHRDSPDAAPAAVGAFTRRIGSQDWAAFLAPFIEGEAAAYQRGERVIYESDAVWGITMVTDTTERSPTFSLAPLENQNRLEEPASWCHFLLSHTPDSATAWRELLGREPRPLEWPEIRETAGPEVLVGYDFSEKLIARRQTRAPGVPLRHFLVSWDESEAEFRFVADFGDGERRASLAVPDSKPLERHLILKMTMNTLSTLGMGRLGRYVDNIMVYVKPANRKLIDRAIRYVRLLAARRLPADQAPGYETVARCLLAEIPRLQPGEPVVLKTLEKVLENAEANHFP
jgi:N-acetylmuramic acid 6-phosphate etherase